MHHLSCVAMGELDINIRMEVSSKICYPSITLILNKAYPTIPLSGRFIHLMRPLKERVPRDFPLQLFSWILFPKTLSIPLRSFRFFSKTRGYIVFIICHWCRTPVVHLDLPISPWVFKQIWNYPNVIFRDLGEYDSWKNWSKKSRDTVSLNYLNRTTYSTEKLYNFT